MTALWVTSGLSPRHCPGDEFVLLSSQMRSLLSRFLGPPEEVVSQIVQADSPSLQGADMAVAYFSLRAGGDFHDFARVSSTRFLFGLLDVAGKREDNQRILQAAQTCFRAAGDELFSVGEPNEADAMVELSRRLNLAIMRAAGGVRSCPAFAGCYNEELGTVCYVNAGHTPGLLRDDSSVVELPATGLPLGLFALAPTDAHIVALGLQSSLVIVSRGVVEAECRHEEFGLAGVKKVMQASARSAKELSRSILERVQDFMCSVPKHNDVTALTLTRGN
jgi:serine phosphatase RsbU (regulator of sigma subunit)